MHQSEVRFSAGQHQLQRGHRQARIQIQPRVPAGDRTRIGVEHHCQEYELLLQPNSGEVRYLQLVDIVKFQRLGQIGIEPEPMIGVGGDSEFAPADRQQVVRLRNASHLLCVNAHMRWIPTTPCDSAQLRISS